MEKILNSRIEELDILKAIAIIAVVFGHVLSVVNKNNEIISLKLLFDFIYIWHIPLFFAVSGFLFRHDRPFSKIFLRLIIPCLIFSLPHIFMHIKTFFWSTDVMTNILLELKFLIFGGGYYWFINFLILMNIASKIFISKDMVRFNIIKILILLFLYFSYLYIIKKIIFVKPIIAFLVIFNLTVYSYWLVNKKIRMFFIKIGMTTMPIYLFDGYLITFEHKYFDNKIALFPILFVANILFPLFMHKITNKFCLARKAFGE